jgi:hypothetical protein
LSTVLSQVEVELYQQLVAHLVMYFFFLAIVSYYVVAGTAAAWLMDSFVKNFIIQTHARQPDKIKHYTPKSQRKRLWYIRKAVSQYWVTWLQQISKYIVLATMQRILSTLGPPRRQSRIILRKVRRHTPKRSFLNRVRRNANIL